MKNKTFLTAVILSACISLFICPELSGRINKADGYGAFAACDTWQKWAEHITGGDFEFTDFARHDSKECEELAAYIYDRFMTNADDDEYACDMTDEYTVPEYDEWYDDEDRFAMYAGDEYGRAYHEEPDGEEYYEEGWADPSYYSDMGDEDSYEVQYNAEHYYSRAYYDGDEYSADEYASFYDDERSDTDDNYEAGDCEHDEAYKEDDEDDCEDYDDEYEEYDEDEDCLSEYDEDEDACSD